MRTKTSGLLLLFITLAVLVFMNAKQEGKKQVKKNVENTILFENVLSSLKDDQGNVTTTTLGKFFGQIGANPEVTFTPNSDGSFSVKVQTVVVSKSQLETFAANNIRWIEDEK